MIGLHWVLAHTPQAVFILFMVGIVWPINWLVAWKTEGPFRTGCLAMSGVVGDFCLIVICTIIAYVMREQSAQLPSWSSSVIFNVAAAAAAFLLVWFFIYLGLSQNRWSDWYHTWVISLTFALLLTSGVPPIIYTLFFGPWPLPLVAGSMGIIFCFMIFIRTLLVDIYSDVLDQPKAWTIYNKALPPKRLYWQLAADRRRR
jgi:heme/copper-type cytochrome/quinol oxidase subunit 4